MKNLITCLVVCVMSCNIFASQNPQNEDFKLIASDGDEFDFFGKSVDIDGNKAIIGAVEDVSHDKRGSAYIYHYVDGQWVEEAKLLASDGASDDKFYIVSLTGDVAIVGAQGNDDNGAFTGSAYIYQFDGSQWTEVTKLLPSDSGAHQRFGNSVCIDGDVALIGAYSDDENAGSAGAAYVFRFNGKQWIEEAKLLASDGGYYDGLGYSVCIDGDVALLGTKWDSQSNSDSGSAYVFRFNGKQWIEEAKLLASDGEASDRFGISVSISGDTAIVGASGDDGYSGSAYIFRYVDGLWVEEAKLLDSEGTELDQFGNSVSIDGNTALIGAPFGNSDEVDGSGLAYIFRFNGKQWINEYKLLDSEGAASDWYGFSVSLSSEVALVGSPYDGEPDVGNSIDSGSAFVFEIEPAAAGACCVGADCTIITELECYKIGGAYQGDGTDCNAAPCYGACCTNYDCVVSDEENCLAFFGQWLGKGTTCNDNSCPAYCPEDVTGDGVVNVSDLLAIIAVWGACP